MIQSLANEYKENVLKGFGAEIAGLHPNKIKEKLQEENVISDKCKVIALIKYAMLCRELTQEEKLKPSMAMFSS